MFQVQDLTRVIIKCLQETILNLFLVQLIEIKTLFMILILRWIQVLELMSWRTLLDKKVNQLQWVQEDLIHHLRFLKILQAQELMIRLSSISQWEIMEISVSVLLRELESLMLIRLSLLQTSIQVMHLLFSRRILDQYLEAVKDLLLINKNQFQAQVLIKFHKKQSKEDSSLWAADISRISL